MAVPKRKTSKARRDSRRSANSVISVPGIVKCPKCGEAKLAHRVCRKCGFYSGKEVIKIASDDKKD